MICLPRLLALGLLTLMPAAVAMAQQPTNAPEAVPQDAITSMTAAMPAKAPAKPQKERKVLVFNLCRGFQHSAVPFGAKALEIMGEKTGAFTTVNSDDIAMFEPASLAQFDAIVMNNTTGELFLPADMDKLTTPEQETARQREAELRKSLLDFVKGGKGLIGIHAATDCFYQWPEYGEMMGGYFDGHPWGAGDTVKVKIDLPRHPLNRPFRGESFLVKDEIYQFREPYSRENLRVLLSLDPTGTDMTKEGIKRTDGDFAVSWVRAYGQGRVFYCSLGHNHEIFWNPALLKHYLRGIQFALGDLKAPSTVKQ